MKDRAVIVGVGESEIGDVGISSLGLCAQASAAALENAGLQKADVDAVLTTESYMKAYNRHGSQFGEYFGFPPSIRYLDSCSSGAGLASGYGLHYAAALVSSGLCDVVLLTAGDNLLSSRQSRDAAVRAISENYEREFAVPYGPIVATRFAWMAQRHMAEFGTTREQLAAVTVSSREWAALTPKALKRDRITVDDVLASKMISTPLRMLDCSLVSDGGAALVVTRPELASGLKGKPVAIKGLGAAFGSGEFCYDDISNSVDLVKSDGMRLAAKRAFEMAGITPKDIDIAYIYDCFTPIVLITLENLGFCDFGQSGPFVADGGIAPGGPLPVNTHGGLLSYAHPAKPGGMFHIVEAVRQLRGDAEERQVAKPEYALVKGQMAHAAGYPITILGQVD